MSQIPDWVEQYIGLPFQERGRGPDGWDCWGLKQKIQREQFDLELPSHLDDYESISIEEGEVENALVQGIAEGWVEVEEENVKAGDGICLSVLGHPFHVGVVAKPPVFVHIHRGINSYWSEWTSPRWYPRIEGFYRHGSRC